MRSLVSKVPLRNGDFDLMPFSISLESQVLTVSRLAVSMDTHEYECAGVVSKRDKLSADKDIILPVELFGAIRK